LLIERLKYDADQLKEISMRSEYLAKIAQLDMVLAFTNLRQEIYNENLTLVHVCNIVREAVEKTGLTEAASAAITADALYSAGNAASRMRASIASRATNRAFFSGLRAENAEHSIMTLPSHEADDMMRQAETLFEKNRESGDGAAILQRLADAGYPAAHYALGVFYKAQEDAGIEAAKRSIDYFLYAADAGHPDAAAHAGDHYFNAKRYFERSLTKAYHYYTKPCAAPLSGAANNIRRENLLAILSAKGRGRRSAIAASIMYAALVLFAALISLESGSYALYALAAAVSFIGAVVLGLLWRFNLSRPYDPPDLFVVLLVLGWVWFVVGVFVV